MAVPDRGDALPQPRVPHPRRRRDPGGDLDRGQERRSPRRDGQPHPWQAGQLRGGGRRSGDRPDPAPQPVLHRETRAPALREDRAMIINALGGLDNPNAETAPADALLQTSDEIAVDQRALADAKASGLTAVNITLGYVMGGMPPYEHTLHEIEVWDAIIGGHPDDLLKVATADDIVR